MTARNWATIDLAAVAHNVRVLREFAGPAQLCAVVKADGYGHGAVAVARTALDHGASWLAVAHAKEGVELRDAGIDAPILLLSEPRPEEIEAICVHDISPTVYSTATVAALSRTVGLRREGRALGVHVKVDTGMHRVGVAPEHLAALLDAIDTRPGVTLEALCTHCAVADDPADDFTAIQIARFKAVTAGVGVMRHAANSAATIAHPASRFDLVRCGIGIYGIDPDPMMAGLADLRPALSLHATVTMVKTVGTGETVSYGRRYRFDEPREVATVSIGYADGVPRRLGLVGHDVLIRGQRLPIRGVVTMDQLLVDCGPETDVEPGDEVVLIGAQGQHTILANDWAEALDTIGYEILCGIAPRSSGVALREPVTLHTMDGIHDLGGMQGFGPVPYTPEEPGRFHERWEGAAGAMVFVLLRSGVTNIDAFRHRLERIDPLSYFAIGYWGRWLAGNEATLIEQGVASEAEIDGVLRGLGRSPEESATAPRLHPTIGFESRTNVAGALRETDADPRFGLGDRVRMPALPPSDGHHRVPRYVRDKVGEVVRLYPSFAFPDARAHDRGEAPQHVYAVRFTGTDVWGPGADPKLANNFDVFESYLEPA